MDFELFYMLVPLVIFGLFIAFPLYVSFRLASLAREIREIRQAIGMTGRVPAAGIAAAPPRPTPEFYIPGVTVPAGPEAEAPPVIPIGLPPQAPPIVPPPAPEKPRAETAWPEVAGAITAVGRKWAELQRRETPTGREKQAAPEKPGKPIDFESVVGANWLAKLGVAAIVLATAFFLQYAFRTNLIGPTARVVIGLIGSAVMIGAGEFLIVKERYRNYAQVLISGGIMVYFLSIYAGYNLYHLMGYSVAFVAFAAAALAASVLAIVNDTQTVAVLSVLGAFAAPVLIRQGGGSPELDSLFRLFGYLAVINVWVLLVMRKRPWHALAGVAFVSTWAIFFLAAPIRSTGWLMEGFAALFLLFACVSGVSLIRSSAERIQAGEIAGVDLTQGGVSLILGGCIAFTVASAVVLAGAGLLGVPDLMLAGVLISLVLAGLAAALPPLPKNDRAIRQLFGYLAAIALSVVLLSSIGSADSTPREQVPLAFGFSVVNYLLFLGAATIMRRKPEAEGPAAALVAANAVIHTSIVAHVLGSTQVWGISAAPIWLPMVALITLGWMGLVCRADEPRPLFLSALIGSALAMPALVQIVVEGASQTVLHSHLAVALFGIEFLLVSLAWIALGNVIAKAPFRADLLVPFVNAASFFALLARAAGTEQLQGVSVLAAAAILMAVYHTIIGGMRLPGSRGDLLTRLIYLGLALTFVTIAIPLQLKASYITVAWAVEAAILLWTARTVRERRIEWYGLALWALAAGKALFIDLSVQPASTLLFLNTRMLSGFAVIATAYFIAWMLLHRPLDGKTEDRGISTGLIAIANAFTLIWVSADLWSYVGRTWAADSRGQAQQLTLSLFWTVYALAAVSVGIAMRARAVRLFGMGLLYLCIVKVFAFDLSGLEQPYRILSFLTLGIILLLVSLLYTRFEQRLGGEGGSGTQSLEREKLRSLGGVEHDQAQRRAS